MRNQESCDKKQDVVDIIEPVVGDLVDEFERGITIVVLFGKAPLSNVDILKCNVDRCKECKFAQHCAYKKRLKISSIVRQFFDRGAKVAPLIFEHAIIQMENTTPDIYKHVYEFEKKILDTFIEEEKSLTIIAFPESPGSIAEFMMCVENEILSKSMKVFVPNRYCPNNREPTDFSFLMSVYNYLQTLYQSVYCYNDSDENIGENEIISKIMEILEQIDMH